MLFSSQLVCIYMIVSKQGQLQPRIHSKARSLSTQLQNGLFTHNRGDRSSNQNLGKTGNKLTERRNLTWVGLLAAIYEFWLDSRSPRKCAIAIKPFKEITLLLIYFSSSVEWFNAANCRSEHGWSQPSSLFLKNETFIRVRYNKTLGTNSAASTPSNLE